MSSPRWSATNASSWCRDRRVRARYWKSWSVIRPGLDKQDPLVKKLLMKIKTLENDGYAVRGCRRVLRASGP